VGLPPRKLQPDRMDARSWFGMTFAKESPAWCATTVAARFRRITIIRRDRPWGLKMPHNRRSVLCVRRPDLGQILPSERGGNDGGSGSGSAGGHARTERQEGCCDPSFR
jgi:hypothetical protein